MCPGCCAAARRRRNRRNRRKRIKKDERKGNERGSRKTTRVRGMRARRARDRARSSLAKKGKKKEARCRGTRPAAARETNTWIRSSPLCALPSMGRSSRKMLQPPAARPLLFSRSEETLVFLRWPKLSSYYSPILYIEFSSPYNLYELLLGKNRALRNEFLRFCLLCTIDKLYSTEERLKGQS